MEQNDYLKYRGKCKKMSEDAIKNNPMLTLVRGYYWDEFWGKQAHWWTKYPDGTIYDPTKDQFPTKGIGHYEEYNGMVQCAQCEKEMPEGDAVFEGRFTFCSGACRMRFVGL